MSIQQSIVCATPRRGPSPGLCRGAVWLLYLIMALALTACVRAADVATQAQRAVQAQQAVQAQTGQTVPALTLVREIFPHEWGMADPVGLVYAPGADQLVLLANGAPPLSGAVLLTITPYEDGLASTPLPFALDNPINVALDAATSHLLLLDGVHDGLVRLPLGGDGAALPDDAVWLGVEGLDLAQPAGMAFDPSRDQLYLLDAADPTLVIVSMHDLLQDAALTPATTPASVIDLAPLSPNLRGLALHPVTHSLWTADPQQQRLYAVNTHGDLLHTYDLAALDLADVRGLAFGPSADLTDAPDTLHLFLADGPTPDPLRLGRIVEAALPATVTSTAASTTTPTGENIIRVPQDAPSIQAGIDMAQEGGLVLVAPGVYHETLHIDKQALTLASHYFTSGDPSQVESTIIDGGGQTVITVSAPDTAAPSGTTPAAGLPHLPTELPTELPTVQIIGLTLQNGDSGIRASAPLLVLDNHILSNDDGIDFEGGTSVVRGNLFADNYDDAIDLDGATAATIEENTLLRSGDDGIEIRLHDDGGRLLEIAIRNNRIEESRGDGIQLIGYPDPTNRIFYIERNIIKHNAKAGLGLMDNAETVEDFRGASLPEPIYVLHNTFRGNGYGITGGDNLYAINNLFAETEQIALKNVDGDSVAAFNLFWQNGTDYQDSTVKADSSLHADPRFDTNEQLLPDSPAIDAATAHFIWQGETLLDERNEEVPGAGPDLGALELPGNTPPGNTPPGNTPPDENERIFLPFVMTLLMQLPPFREK